jgi:hypothetical protein
MQTVQSILTHYWPVVFPSLYMVSSFTMKVVNALIMCRTDLMGSHLFRCDNPDCGNELWLHNSCRNRHCSICQARERAAWLAKQLTRLLPVRYFHVVFTIPSELRSIVSRNRRIGYTLLFKAASQTILSLAADPKRLNGRAGLILMLHTWSQRLTFHPHVHGIVPGGVLSKDGDAWHGVAGKFLLPRDVVCALFKGKFLGLLKDAYVSGKIHFDAAAFQNAITCAYRKKWNVHLESPFESPIRVVKYLAAYSNRVAISDNRILSVQNGMVRFTYLNRTHNSGAQWKTESIDTATFIRRFVDHILPRGLVKIRYYGILSNRTLQAMQPVCSALIQKQHPDKAVQFHHDVADEMLKNVCSDTAHTCRVCRQGALTIIGYRSGNIQNMGVDD